MSSTSPVPDAATAPVETKPTSTPTAPLRPTSAPITQPRLYLPYSTLRAAGGPRRPDLRHAPIHWFRVGREEPLVPYERLILGYKALAPLVKTQAELLVNEFFSEEEFRMLRDYLRERHREDLRTSVLMAPISHLRADTATRVGSLRPFSLAAAAEAGETAASDGDGHGLYRLSAEAGYTLPFEVCGFYLAPVHRPLVAAANAGIGVTIPSMASSAISAISEDSDAPEEETETE